jgi:3-deoxy-D-manno-octulosonic-acid transferase
MVFGFSAIEGAYFPVTYWTFFWKFSLLYHYFDRLEARFAKYDDSDSESKNIIYLLCDVSRS